MHYYYTKAIFYYKSTFIICNQRWLPSIEKNTHFYTVVVKFLCLYLEHISVVCIIYTHTYIVSYTF